MGWLIDTSLWIAVERDFRLLTSNAKDFSDIPGLRMTVVKLP